MSIYSSAGSPYPAKDPRQKRRRLLDGAIAIEPSTLATRAGPKKAAEKVGAIVGGADQVGELINFGENNFAPEPLKSRLKTASRALTTAIHSDSTDDAIAPLKLLDNKRREMLGPKVAPLAKPDPLLTRDLPYVDPAQMTHDIRSQAYKSDAATRSAVANKIQSTLVKLDNSALKDLTSKSSSAPTASITRRDHTAATRGRVSAPKDPTSKSIASPQADIAHARAGLRAKPAAKAGDKEAALPMGKTAHLDSNAAHNRAGRLTTTRDHSTATHIQLNPPTHKSNEKKDLKAAEKAAPGQKPKETPHVKETQKRAVQAEIAKLEAHVASLGGWDALSPTRRALFEGLRRAMRRRHAAKDEASVQVAEAKIGTKSDAVLPGYLSAEQRLLKAERKIGKKAFEERVADVRNEYYGWIRAVQYAGDPKRHPLSLADYWLMVPSRAYAVGKPWLIADLVIVPPALKMWMLENGKHPDYKAGESWEQRVARLSEIELSKFYRSLVVDAVNKERKPKASKTPGDLSLELEISLTRFRALNEATGKLFVDTLTGVGVIVGAAVAPPPPPDFTKDMTTAEALFSTVVYVARYSTAKLAAEARSVVTGEDSDEVMRRHAQSARLVSTAVQETLDYTEYVLRTGRAGDELVIAARGFVQAAGERRKADADDLKKVRAGQMTLEAYRERARARMEQDLIAALTIIDVAGAAAGVSSRLRKLAKRARDHDEFSGAAPVTPGAKRLKSQFKAERPEKGGDILEMVGKPTGDPDIDAILAKAKAGLESGLYDPALIRSYLEELYGTDRVRSTTTPPTSQPNVKFAGKRHPVTGIPFDERGYPIFDKVELHRYDFTGDATYFRLSPAAQRARAARKLASDIEAGRFPRGDFTDQELRLMKKGKPILHYVWHHPGQNPGVLQFVERVVHGDTGHVGSTAMRKGK